MEKRKKKSLVKRWWFLPLVCIVVFFVLALSPSEKAGPALAIYFLLLAALIFATLVILVYSFFYFKGNKFKSLKESIYSYINDCNELNRHIEDLRSSYVSVKKTDYGEASYRNVGRRNYKRNGIANAKYSPNVYDCSRQVCDSARKKPFEYICKYFNIKKDAQSLSEFEEILNNFVAAEEGKELSKKKREIILNQITHNIPWVIRKLFPKKLDKELGFEEFAFDEFFFPVFTFRYISSGGNSGAQFDVTMDIPMLERFVGFLSEQAQFKSSAAGQRRLMTPKLRRSIIERDNNTCLNCGNSTYNEPNLLLEVDHIIPIARGGLTTEDNLQTLCWKCNRHKGARIA